MGLFSLFSDGFVFFSVYHTPDFRIFFFNFNPSNVYFSPLFALPDCEESARRLRGVCEELRVFTGFPRRLNAN